MNVSKSLFAAEAVRKLDAICPNAEHGDTEVDHVQADKILIDLLRDIGLPDVADAYERCRDRAGFWYA